MKRLSLTKSAAAISSGIALPAARGSRLRPNDVELWRIGLDEPSDAGLDYLRGLLSPDEAERAAKFFFERDRRRFIVGRGILRVLLGRYLDCAPADIAFRYGANGKPALAQPPPEPLYFNLAHSEGLALYAFTRTGEVGVDLERMRDLPDWEFIASSCFTRADQARVNAAAPADRPLEFFRAWTRQEAKLKATGEGIGGEGASPSTLAEAILHSDNPAFTFSATARPRLYPLQVADGFAAALAVTGNARWVSCLSWERPPWLGQARSPRRSPRMVLEQLPKTGVNFL